MKTVPIITALAILSVGITGCSKSSSADAAGGKNSNAAAKSKLAKLGIEDIKIGDGGEFGIKQTAQAGDRVFLIYTGTLADGTVFDSNTDPSKDPIGVTLGDGMVIKGWEQGLIGMKVGGERKLSIPSSLGYGDKAAPGGKIPANSDLYFDVKMVDMVPHGTENDVTPDDLKLGTGPAIAKGDTVTVHYSVANPKGELLDSDNGKGFTFVYGSDSMYPGPQTGMEGMKQGGIRKIRLGPAVAMMATSKMAMMKPPSVQILKIELVKVSPPAHKSS